MGKKGSFVQVRQTSSAKVTEEGGRGMEGRVRASSDLTITVDFPLAISHQDDVPMSTSTDPVREMKSDIISNIGTPPQQLKTTSTLEKLFQSCNKYGQVATCHGMHTICARNVTRLRRLFWIVVIITCLTVLGFIVRERIRYYYSNPSTVNVAREYEKSIPFPAVTICNENQYSISKAYDLHLNEILLHLLSPDDTDGDILYSEEQGQIRMNELHILLGNSIENMLLSCQWHEGGICGPENFSEIITDGGRCYTFNGRKNYKEHMEVHNIGSAKGVRFLMNTEEYERMPLSSMSSGIRILIHEQEDYPLVKQLGQSVAPGNHAFISLQYKKEIRLGPPYDMCQNGNLRFIPNTYHYTLPACQTECYFAYTLTQCGCSDFFIPSNFTACSVAEYTSCLRNVQRNYPSIEDNICECRTPCIAEYIDAEYSYAALSELAMETLNKETVENIEYRHKRAVDIYQFISRETQYKKHIFLNFTTALDRAKELYSSDLNMLETKVTQTLSNCSNKYMKLCDTIDAILWEQALVIKKEFVDPVRRMDRTTIDRVIDDMDMVAARVKNLVREHTANPRNSTQMRYLMVMDDLMTRSELLNATLRNLNVIKGSFFSGVPLSHYSFSEDTAKRMRWSISRVIPKKLLRKAFSHENVTSIKSSIVNISSSLLRMMEIVEKTFETKENTIQQLEQVVNEFIYHCRTYTAVKDTFFEETVEWPLQALEQKSVSYRESKLACDFHFKTILGTVQKETVRIGLSLASANGYFSTLGRALHDYLNYLNSSNFDIAKLVLGDNFLSAASNLQAVSHEMRDNVNELYGLLNNVVDCLDDNLKKITKDEALSDMLAVISADVGVSVANLTREISIGIYEIQKSFMRREESNAVSLRLLELSNSIKAEFRKFADDTKMDLAFYRRNFIYLDIFFGDISYTVMEQQKVYRGYDLFSDIGGSMGLLVGASIISLLEIMDLFCLLSIALCRN